MSMVVKVGEIVSVDDHAIYDYFADKNIVTVYLATETGERISVRLPLGIRDLNFHEPAHLHDLVSIGWDYGNCEFRILVQDSRRQPIPDDIPVTGDRIAGWTDILDSLDPPDKKD